MRNHRIWKVMPILELIFGNLTVFDFERDLIGRHIYVYKK